MQSQVESLVAPLFRHQLIFSPVAMFSSMSCTTWALPVDDDYVLRVICLLPWTYVLLRISHCD